MTNCTLNDHACPITNIFGTTFNVWSDGYVLTLREVDDLSEVDSFWIKKKFLCFFFLWSLLIYRFDEVDLFNILWLMPIFYQVVTEIYPWYHAYLTTLHNLTLLYA